MTVNREEIYRLVRRVIIRGLQRNGDRIFHTSQQTQSCYVPVAKGILKNSGYKKDLPTGVEIGYTAPYAARVHYGGPFIPYTGVQTVNIRQHRRRGYTDKKGHEHKTTVVQPHIRQYINAKLVGFRPKLGKFERGRLIFRVMRGEPEREGTFFLTRALAEELHHLPEDIQYYADMLERTGHV